MSKEINKADNNIIKERKKLSGLTIIIMILSILLIIVVTTFITIFVVGLKKTKLTETEKDAVKVIRQLYKDVEEKADSDTLEIIDIRVLKNNKIKKIDFLKDYNTKLFMVQYTYEDEETGDEVVELAIYRRKDLIVNSDVMDNPKGEIWNDYMYYSMSTNALSEEKVKIYNKLIDLWESKSFEGETIRLDKIKKELNK